MANVLSTHPGVAARRSAPASARRKLQQPVLQGTAEWAVAATVVLAALATLGLVASGALDLKKI
jgi:hypothetical protein